MAIITRLMAQKMRLGIDRVMLVSGGTVAEVVDGDDGYRARGSW
jgi:hypothetical protein